MTRVVARIQGHPSRSALHDVLVESLAPMPTEVSLHSSDPPNPWAGYQQALRDPPDCTHLLVLQDDTVACRNLPRAVDLIAKSKPDDPVALFHSYLPRNNLVDLLKMMKWGGGPYLRSRYAKFWPVIAVLWPVDVSQDFLRWTEDNARRLPGAPNLVASDDAVFGEWGRSTQATLWVTVPSLVEHPDVEESLIGRRALWGKDSGRRALKWIGPDADPLEIDWS